MGVPREVVTARSCGAAASRDRRMHVLALREKSHPESIAVRRANSQADRTLLFEPAADGTGWLHSYQRLPVAQAI